jgi:glycoprotein 3-alpha-L-fucosyltransferase
MQIIIKKHVYCYSRNDIIPVVMGARPEDYKRTAPPHSFIHVDDFESPKHLADYLHKLDKNDDLYNEYFLWKGTGTFINTLFWCRLCSMVNIGAQYPMWYNDINKWWRGPEVCIKPSGKPWASWRNHTIIDHYQNTIEYGYDREAVV